jgi:hypothetical protein
MQFRWLVVLTLWTLLIGPIMNAPQNQASSTPQRAAALAFAKR